MATSQVSEQVWSFADFLPTAAELAGTKPPHGIDGISLAPTLFGKAQPERPFLYREFPGYVGFQVVRIGDWKGIRHDLATTGKKAKGAKPSLSVELYNIRTDPAETTDVADQHPDIAAKIERLMREQHTPSKEFPFPALDGLSAKSSLQSRSR